MLRPQKGITYSLDIVVMMASMMMVEIPAVGFML